MIVIGLIGCKKGYVIDLRTSISGVCILLICWNGPRLVISPPNSITKCTSFDDRRDFIS